MILKEYGINIQKLLISLNTPRHGGMKIVAETWRTIDSLNRLKIGNDSRAWLRKPNVIFFDLKIQEIANKNCGPWELMDWVKKCKLLAIKAI